ncbi:hypothetical protein [Streptosporangium fragile]|uniref:hypothetical protein n=1 Tax=Streptosporangium fragile TaxID=46186 RepID=UPI0031F146AA
MVAGSGEVSSASAGPGDALSAGARLPVSAGAGLSGVSDDRSPPEPEEPEDSGGEASAVGAASREGLSCWAGGSAAGGAGADSGAVGGVEVRPGSASAVHGWAMTALVVAETAASRRPETRVTRRDELRGGMGGSSWIY